MQTRGIATSDTHEPADARADNTLDRRLSVHRKEISVGERRREVC